MADPFRLVTKVDRALDENRARMLRQLDHYRKHVEAGEIDQLGIVVTYRDGGHSTSLVELAGKRLQLVAGMEVWKHRVVHGILYDDE